MEEKEINLQQENQLLKFDANEITFINGIQNKAKKFYEKISVALFEREELARLIILAVFSKEHIFLYGPPGTAKSNIAEALKELTKGVWFKELMTDFTKFENIFGKEIQQSNGLSKRVLEGKLPKAEYAFLDEIFKANAEILNSLLTILNERQFDDDYNGTIDVPLRTALAASNEFPRTSYLKALFERFIFRIPVPNIKHKPNRRKLFDGKFEKIRNLPIISEEEINFVQEGYKKVKFNDETADLLSDVIDVLFSLVNSEKHTEDSIEAVYEISGRTMVKMGAIFRLSAYLNKRTETDLSDLFLMRYIVWNNIHERKIILPKLNQELFGGEEEIHGDTSKSLETFSIFTLRYLKTFKVKLNGSEACLTERSFMELRNEIDAFKKEYIEILNDLEKVKDRLIDCRKKEKLIKNNIFLFYERILDWKVDESLIIVNSEKFNDLTTMVDNYKDIKIEEKYKLMLLIERTFELHNMYCLEIEKWLKEYEDFFTYKLKFGM
ncbi:AAA family ATPase (plasmid) [Aliarcobacter lanthieri]|uniref:AAA family ATPase n=1 Tax=Aliarcobacter lanthieri TaxID=1355374 RepID=UPI003AAAC17E